MVSVRLFFSARSKGISGHGAGDNGHQPRKRTAMSFSSKLGLISMGSEIQLVSEDTRRAAQLVSNFVVRYGALRRESLSSDLYSFAAYRRRTWFSATKRREEYLRIVTKEVERQAQSLEDAIGFCEFGAISRQARLLAATSVKTAAVRLKNRADFTGTISGIFTLFVSAILLLAKIYANVSLGLLFIPLAFALIAHIERHWTLDESVIFEEAYEILSSKYLDRT